VPIDFFKRNPLEILFSSQEDKELRRKFAIITGSKPNNLKLYQRAMRHVSAASTNDLGFRDSYERLEYLGDAILGMVVAEMLFKKFPFKEEGFLTEVRSKLVNRESLNKLSIKIGLKDLVIFTKNKGSTISHKSVYGDSLEALIGAIYLDKGFNFCQSFIVHRLIVPHFDVDELSKTLFNYKSKIIEWGQKENISVEFRIVQDNEGTKSKQFIAQVFINDEGKEKGFGFSKKKAEQLAAQKTLEVLNLNID
jgi:ribonuclease-3